MTRATTKRVSEGVGKGDRFPLTFVLDIIKIRYLEILFAILGSHSFLRSGEVSVNPV